MAEEGNSKNHEIMQLSRKEAEKRRWYGHSYKSDTDSAIRTITT